MSRTDKTQGEGRTAPGRVPHMDYTPTRDCRQCCAIGKCPVRNAARPPGLREIKRVSMAEHHLSEAKSDYQVFSICLRAESQTLLGSLEVRRFSSPSGNFIITR